MTVKVSLLCKSTKGKRCNMSRSLRIPHATPVHRRWHGDRPVGRMWIWGPLILILILRCPLTWHGTAITTGRQVVILTHRLWAHRSTPAAPTTTAVGHWGRAGSSVFSEFRATAVGAQATTEDAEKKQASNTSRDTDDKTEMTVDPRRDFFADGAALTYTL